MTTGETPWMRCPDRASPTAGRRAPLSFDSSVTTAFVNQSRGARFDVVANVHLLESDPREQPRVASVRTKSDERPLSKRGRQKLVAALEQTIELLEGV